jgi:hypothetical protein
MRDKYYRGAARFQIEDEIEEILLLLGSEARRRFVEDDDLGLVQDGARDLHHLLLGGAEQTDGRSRVDVELQRLQELLGGDVDAAQAVEKRSCPRNRFCATVMVGTRLVS